MNCNSNPKITITYERINSITDFVPYTICKICDNEKINVEDNILVEDYTNEQPIVFHFNSRPYYTKCSEVILCLCRVCLLNLDSDISTDDIYFNENVIYNCLESKNKNTDHGNCSIIKSHKENLSMVEIETSIMFINYMIPCNHVARFTYFYNHQNELYEYIINMRNLKITDNNKYYEKYYNKKNKNNLDDIYFLEKNYKRIKFELNNFINKIMSYKLSLEEEFVLGLGHNIHDNSYDFEIINKNYKLTKSELININKKYNYHLNDSYYLNNDDSYSVSRKSICYYRAFCNECPRQIIGLIWDA